VDGKLALFIGRRVLQRPCPGPEAGVEPDRRFAGIADRALDFFEIARGEFVTLLQIYPLGCGFAGGVGRDRVELGREPRDEVGEFVLAPAYLLQLLDQRRALPIGLFEKPAKSEGQATRSIIRQGSRKRADLGQPLLGRDPPRGEAPHQTGNPRIGTPIAEAVDWRPVPIGCRGELRHQPLLAGPVGIVVSGWRPTARSCAEPHG